MDQRSQTTLIYTGFKAILVSILLALVSPSAGMAANYCSPSTSRVLASGYDTEIRNIVANIDGYREQYKAAGNSPSLDQIKEFKSRIEGFINRAPLQYKQMAIYPIYSFYAVIEDAASLLLRVNPLRLTSLNALANTYGITMKSEDVMWVIPNKALIGNNYELVSLGNMVRIALTPTDALFRLIKGEANMARPVESSYFETSKCLLNSALLAKYANNAALQYKLSDKVPVGKACGNISYAQIFNAYMKMNTRDDLDLANRNALLNSVPNFSTFMDEAFVKQMKALELFDNGGFIYLYLGAQMADGKITEAVAAPIREKVSSLVSSALGRFGTNPALISFYASPSIKSKLAGLVNNCGTDNESFFTAIDRAEEVFFIQSFDSAVGLTTMDFSQLNNANIDVYLAEILTRVKVDSMSKALMAALLISGKSSEDAQETVNAFTKQVIIPEVGERIRTVMRNGSIRVFTDRVKAYYADVSNDANPLKVKRETFDSGLATTSVQIAELMAKPLAQLPYKKSVLNEIYGPSVASLNPNTQSLMNIVLSAKGFKNAKAAYAEVLNYVNEDMRGARARGAVLPEVNSFWSVAGLRDAVTSWGHNTIAYWNPAKARTYKQKAQDEKMMQDFEVVRKVGEAYGFSSSNEEPKVLGEVLPGIRARVKPEQMVAFEKAYRTGLRKGTFAEWRILEMPYQGAELYRAVFNARRSRAGRQVPINFALAQTSQNQFTNLMELSKVKKLSDLDPMIMRSSFLGILLGKDDMAAHIMRQDFWPSVRALGEQYSVNEFIAPHLVQFHTEYRSLILRKEIIRTDKWDDFYDALGAYSMPLMGIWAVRGALNLTMGVAGIREVCALFRLDKIPSLMKVAADNSRFFVNGYWNVLLIGMMGDGVVQAYRWGDSNSELKALNRMAFSDTTNYDPSVVFYVPILDEGSFTSQIASTQNRISQTKMAVMTTGATVAFPLVSYMVSTKLFAWMGKQNYRLTEYRLSRAAKNGNTSAAESFINDKVQSYSRYYGRQARLHNIYFSRLGLRRGTWKVSELKAALAKVKGDKVPGAQQAYKELISILNTKFYTAQDFPIHREAFTRAVFGGSESEVNLLIQEFNRLNSAGVR